MIGLGLHLVQLAVRGGTATRILGPQILISNRNQDENTAIGTTIGTFTVVGGTGTYTFTKTADPDSAFTLTAGALKNAILFDYEAATSHNVTIHADNGAGSTADRTLAIGVNDIDEVPPVITVSLSQTVQEGTAFSLTLTANKPATWTKTGGADSALFTLAGTTLSLPAQNFSTPADADANNSYLVQVTATSLTGFASNATITLNVTDIAAPDAPVIVWTTGTGDNTPDFGLTGDLVTSDTVRFQRSDASDFSTMFTALMPPDNDLVSDPVHLQAAFVGSSLLVDDLDEVSPLTVDDFTTTVTSGQDAANALTFNSGTIWADGTWYMRARTERGGFSGNSAWSNTVSKTIATSGGGGGTDRLLLFNGTNYLLLVNGTDKLLLAGGALLGADLVDGSGNTLVDGSSNTLTAN